VIGSLLIRQSLFNDEDLRKRTKKLVSDLQVKKEDN